MKIPHALPGCRITQVPIPGCRRVQGRPWEKVTKNHDLAVLSFGRMNQVYQPQKAEELHPNWMESIVRTFEPELSDHNQCKPEMIYAVTLTAKQRHVV